MFGEAIGFHKVSNPRHHRTTRQQTGRPCRSRRRCRTSNSTSKAATTGFTALLEIPSLDGGGTRMARGPSFRRKTSTYVGRVPDAGLRCSNQLRWRSVMRRIGSGKVAENSASCRPAGLCSSTHSTSSIKPMRSISSASSHTKRNYSTKLIFG